MRNYIIQRVIWIFIILFSTLTITFVLLKTAPEYPPAKVEERDVWLERQVYDGYYTREYYTDSDEDLEIVESIKVEYEDELNRTVFILNPINDSTTTKVFYRVPTVIQYQQWLKNVITEWDWGYSTKIRANTPAFDIIAERIPLTLSLNILILVFYIPLGFTFGIIAALKKDTLIDNLMQIFIIFFLSLPALVFILLLIILFSYQLDNFLPSLFPIIARSDFWALARGYVIPVVAAGLPAVAGFTRMLRAELSEVLTSEFVLLAKTKGLSHQQAVLRHAIRNSLVPMIPIIIGSFARLLSGSFILERVYAIPGVGSVTLRALTKGAYDYNVLMSSSAFYSVIALFAVLIVDLSYGIIDPRIRMGAKR
ncbi:ABC transporter permease [Candidatus Xianfuyuplasma coldseepsis]|uniref:ABC transporter permease n=1 Tax=Candidatus Xianfuyuplasma coldseepsis TaxID=2782163 RepID=A0A7L7KSU1_9MOLU|nr:ABC transporter permease [Xianfuyuplasma coldseepsis]QMS85342.1 ABC transporter permease [Xianfuyuplasma coldseepsis]